MSAQPNKIAIELPQRNVSRQTRQQLPNQQQPQHNNAISKDKLTQCLINSIDIASSHLAKTISNLLGLENDSDITLLFKYAGINIKANNNHKLLSEYHQLRSNRQYIGQQFVDELILLFTDNISTLNTGPKTFTFNQASDVLLDPNQNKIEESAIIANLSTKAHKKYSDNLGALYKRYLFAFEKSGIRKNTLPLGPEQICLAFMKTLDIYNISDDLKKICYKLFDTHVIQNLEPLYKNINTIFHDADILPELVFEQGHNINEKPIKQRRAFVKPKPASRKATHLKSANNEKEDTFGVFMHLILMKQHMDSVSQRNTSLHSHEKFNEKYHVIESKNKSTISAEKLDSLLSSFQNNTHQILANDKNSVLSNEMILDYIFTETSKESRILSEKLDQSDSACIDLVCMLFKTIAEDHNLPSHMKKLICSLLLKSIKTALAEKRFFNELTHPARVFIDLLATSSICWNELNDISNDPLYLESNRIVNDITGSSTPDNTIFNKAIKDLKSFLEINANSRELLIQDRQKSEETAANKISELINNQEVPAPVLLFLTNIWKNVFTKIATEEGTQSKSWENIVKLTTDIIISTQPKITDKEKQNLLSTIPRLVSGINDGLSSISSNRKQIKHFLNELENIHIASLQGNLIDVFSTVTPITPEAEVSNNKSDTDDLFNTDKLIAEIDSITAKFENLDISNCRSDVYQETINNLPIGSWLEFTEENNNKLRLKLAWKNKQSTEYSFVDRSGTIVAETAISQLASDFRDGHIHIIDTSPITERAFNLIRRTLKKQVLKK